jgi:uncharacterized protein (TIGR02300 family)
VTKPALGTKRVCPNCATRYYDLHRDPVTCPKCGTVIRIDRPPARAAATKTVPLRVKKAPLPEEEVRAPAVESGTADEPDEDEGQQEKDEDEDEGQPEKDEPADDALLPEQEDDDVSEIIGDVEGDER